MNALLRSLSHLLLSMTCALKSQPAWCLALVLLIFFVGTIGCKRPPAYTASGSFRDAGGTCTLTYPPSWDIGGGEGVTALVLFTGDGKSSKAPSKILLLIAPPPGGDVKAMEHVTYDQILSGMLAELQKNGSRASVTECNSVMLSGETARRVLISGYRVDAGSAYLSVSVICLHAGTTYAIEGSSLPEHFEQLKLDFDRVVSSFRFDK
jgi:hypothetical protein